MFVDASALVAILKGEPESEALVARIEAAGTEVLVSPVVRYETTVSVAVSLARARGEGRAVPADFRLASALVAELFAEIGAKELPLTTAIGLAAVMASGRYGKVSGHAADLNMGDCFAYACASEVRVPLLYKGRDFAQTDIG